MIRIIIIRNLIILKGEIMTFHYMVMANHAIYNRMLMEILEETGLTAGQPKVLDYLGYHDGASQKALHPKPKGRVKAAPTQRGPARKTGLQVVRA